MEITKEKPKRLQYVDVAKFIGVLLVIFCHSLPAKNDVLLLLYSFHIPLFFLINGLTMKFKKEENFAVFLWKKIKSYIIPLFFLGIIIIFCVMAKANHDYRTLADYYFFRELGEIAKCQRYYSLWFLTALLASDLLFHLCHFLGRGKLLPTTIFVALIFAYGVFYNSKIRVALTLNLDAAFVAIIFVYFGYLFSHPSTTKVREFLLKNRFISLGVGAVLLGIGLTLARINYVNHGSNLEMFADSYNMFYLTIPSAILSSYGVILISNGIRNVVLGELGKTSIVLFSLHQQFTFTLFNDIFKDYITEVGALPNTDAGWYLYAFYRLLFSIAILIPLYYLIIYSPFAFGLSHKQPKYMQKFNEKVLEIYKKIIREKPVENA